MGMRADVTIGGSMALRPSALFATLQRRFFMPPLFRPKTGVTGWVWWASIVSASVLLLACSAVEAQAIDCASNALNHSELAVCASASLRSLAASVDQRYPRVAGDVDVQRSQLAWITVRDRCNGNVACLTATYRERNAYLAALPAASGPGSSRAPLKHLFLRHAPAQLLDSVATQRNVLANGINATDKLDRAAGAALAVKPAPWNPLWLLTGVLCASALMWRLLTNVCGKCPNCHHWFARVEIDQRNLATGSPELPPHRRRGLRKRAFMSNPSSSEPARSRNTAVRHYNQCRMCLHEWETTSKETL
jgi:uncharacterized protein